MLRGYHPLQVSAEMGPIELIPGSHLAGWLAAEGGGEGGGGGGRGGGGGGGGGGGDGDGSGALLAIPIPRGAALLYDTRLRHRGGANRARKRRPVFYVTLLAAAGHPPSGLPYTIEPDEAGCAVLRPAGVDLALCDLVRKSKI